MVPGKIMVINHYVKHCSNKFSDSNWYPYLVSQISGQSNHSAGWIGTGNENKIEPYLAGHKSGLSQFF